jgi:hypothetical protein
MADGLGKERSAEVQKLVDKVFELYTPMARPEWLSWGGELLFSDLQEAVERELRELEVKRRLEEEEKEAVRKKADEEETRRLAVEAKAAWIEARRAALGQARQAAMLEFRAKTMSREELQRRNAEFASEASSISREEAGIEAGVYNNEEAETMGVASERGQGDAPNNGTADDDEGAKLPVVEIGKRKVEDQGGDGEDEVEAKRTRFATSGLLDFEGPVSVTNFPYLIVLRHHTLYYS